MQSFDKSCNRNLNYFLIMPLSLISQIASIIFTCISWLISKYRTVGLSFHWPPWIFWSSPIMRDSDVSYCAVQTLHILMTAFIIFVHFRSKVSSCMALCASIENVSSPDWWIITPLSMKLQKLHLPVPRNLDHFL